MSRENLEADLDRPQTVTHPLSNASTLRTFVLRHSVCLTDYYTGGMQKQYWTRLEPALKQKPRFGKSMEFTKLRIRFCPAFSGVGCPLSPSTSDRMMTFFTSTMKLHLRYAAFRQSLSPGADKRCLVRIAAWMQNRIYDSDCHKLDRITSTMIVGWYQQCQNLEGSVQNLVALRTPHNAFNKR